MKKLIVIVLLALGTTNAFSDFFGTCGDPVMQTSTDACPDPCGSMTCHQYTWWSTYCHAGIEGCDQALVNTAVTDKLFDCVANPFCNCDTTTPPLYTHTIVKKKNQCI